MKIIHITRVQQSLAKLYTHILPYILYATMVGAVMRKYHGIAVTSHSRHGSSTSHKRNGAPCSASNNEIHQFLALLVPMSLPTALQWRHSGRDSVSNHQSHDCLLNRLFRRRSKRTSKLRVTGLCAGNSPVTGEFPAQMASNAENVSIW